MKKEAIKQAVTERIKAEQERTGDTESPKNRGAEVVNDMVVKGYLTEAEGNERGKIVLDLKKRNDICEELGVIAGILDMLFLIDVADAWSMRNENLGLVIMDARNRALSLSDQI